jgi:hypothetical protein
MGHHLSKLTFFLALCTTYSGTTTMAQEPAADTTAQALFVFLDCNGPNCDFDHFRREIAWVNWVRDRQDGDVHLLVTTERTGGGGWHYTLDYIGLSAFEGVNKSLSYTSDPDDTDTEVRESLTQTMALGLVQFVEVTPLASQLRVVYEAPEGAVLERDERDPWNLWVFRIGVDGSIEGEASQREYSLGGSARADRVSENFKINFSFSGHYDREEFEIEDEDDAGIVTVDTIIDVSEDYTARLTTVWSLTDHWSAGGTATANRSTFLNNIFPYDESTRRQLTLRYALEVARFDYELETVEGKMDEILPRHSMLVSVAVQQPWGEIHGSVEGIQYLHDPATHRINTFANFEYRLFRGFNFDVFAQFSRIKDQFFLPSEELTEEEVLLERRQRETDFRFDIGIGFSYRFGSKFANIVNPRMGGGRRRRFF